MKKFHIYFGLFFSYICFFIFFTASFGYFKNEFNLYMQPNLYTLEYKNQQYIDIGLNYLKEKHQNADLWEITPPSSLKPYVAVSWNDDKKVLQKKANRPQVRLDSKTGEIIGQHYTYGINFISSMHYNLWFVDKKIARIIMAIFGLIFWFLLLSGIIIQSRKIFKDFFTLRAQVFLMDAHIITAVSGIAIFTTLVLSGIYIITSNLITPIYQDIGEQNNKIMQEKFKKQAITKIEERKNTKDQNLTSIAKQKTANKFTPDNKRIKELVFKNDKPIKSIKIQREKADNGFLQIDYVSNRYFTDDGIAFSAIAYDINSGKIVDEIESSKLNGAKKFTSFIKVFHNAKFANGSINLLFFIFAMLGVAMCVTGTLFYQKKNNLKTIKVLNNTVYIGLVLAVGIYLFSNQIIDSSIPKRLIYTTNSFFITLAILLIVSIVFVKKPLYEITSFVTSGIFLLISVVGVFQGALMNIESIKITILCLLFSTFFTYIGFQFKKVGI